VCQKELNVQAAHVRYYLSNSILSVSINRWLAIVGSDSIREATHAVLNHALVDLQECLVVVLIVGLMTREEEVLVNFFNWDMSEGLCLSVMHQLIEDLLDLILIPL